jgi:AraC-like DNA-binding protein
MSDDETIDLNDLKIHAPGVAAGREEFQSSKAESTPGFEDNTLFSPTGAVLDERLSVLARELIKAEFQAIKNFHPALRNALEYLAGSFHEAITLRDVARHAALSASHLAFLFQKTLGVNFKLFLAILRIEEAKQLLVEQPHLRITEISYQVGFGDLRHFERTFKRLLSRTPREYRSLLLGEAEPPDSES